MQSRSKPGRVVHNHAKEVTTTQRRSLLYCFFTRFCFQILDPCLPLTDKLSNAYCWDERHLLKWNNSKVLSYSRLRPFTNKPRVERIASGMREAGRGSRRGRRPADPWPPTSPYGADADDGREACGELVSAEAVAGVHARHDLHALQTHKL